MFPISAFSVPHGNATCFDFASSGSPRSFGVALGLPLTAHLGSQSSSNWQFAFAAARSRVPPPAPRVAGDLELSHDLLTGPGFASPSAEPRGCRSFRGGTGGGAGGSSGGTLLLPVDSFLSALTTSGLRAPRHLTISRITSCDSFNLLTQSSRVMCVTGIPSIESTWGGEKESDDEIVEYRIMERGGGGGGRTSSLPVIICKGATRRRREREESFLVGVITQEVGLENHIAAP